MRSRYLWFVVLVAVLCVAIPSVALAKGTVNFSSINGQYTVAKGANLTIAGSLHAMHGSPDWSMHAPVVVQRRVRRVWKDLLVLRMSKRGNFKFTLVKPHASDYRVLYPGCKHYLSAVADFEVEQGTPRTGLRASVKLPPLLSVRNISPFLVATMAAAPGRTLTVGSSARFPLSFDIVTSQTPEAMVGSELNFQVLASVTGATYTPVYTFPSPLSFNGKTHLSLIAPVPLIGTVSPDFYDYYKIVATWRGNRFTTSGKARGTTPRFIF